MKKTLIVSWEVVRIGDYILRFTSNSDLTRFDANSIDLKGRVIGLKHKHFDGLDINPAVGYERRNWPRHGWYLVEREDDEVKKPPLEWVACQVRDIVLSGDVQFYSFSELTAKDIATQLNKGRPNNFAWFCPTTKHVQEAGGAWGICDKRFLKACPTMLPAVPPMPNKEELTSSEVSLIKNVEQRFQGEAPMSRKLSMAEANAWSKKLRLLQAEVREKDRMQVTVDTSFWDD